MSNNKVDMVTNYFLQKSSSDKRTDFTNKKLQKLLYYTQAWSLVLRGKPMFSEKFEAWIHGPAIPSVYRKYKKYGFLSITQAADKSLVSKLKEDEMDLLADVWSVYGKYDGDYLELLTHNEEPWQKARENSDPFKASNNEISEDGMKAFYGQLKSSEAKG